MIFSHIFFFLIGIFVSLIYHTALFENIKRAQKPIQIQLGFFIRLALVGAFFFIAVRMGSLPRIIALMLGFIFARALLMSSVKKRIGHGKNNPKKKPLKKKAAVKKKGGKT